MRFGWGNRPSSRGAGGAGSGSAACDGIASACTGGPTMGAEDFQDEADPPRFFSFKRDDRAGRGVAEDGSAGEWTCSAEIPLGHRRAGAHFDGPLHAWGGAVEDRQDYGAGERTS